MKFDILFPSVILAVIILTVALYLKIEKKVKVVFEERKFTTRDTMLLVLLMGVMVTVMAFAPGQAIRILFMASYSFVMFFFFSAILRKWYLAIFPPVVFILSYLYFWNLALLSIFALVFAVIATVYMGVLFSWKTTWIFAILLTVMDIIQVFVTGFMVRSASTMIIQGLPIVVLLPTFPVEGIIVLGLGDIFLAGLLTIQTTLKHGWKSGILTAITLSIAWFIFEVVAFNTMFAEFFPATVVVICGWSAGMGIIYLRSRRRRISSK